MFATYSSLEDVFEHYVLFYVSNPHKVAVNTRKQYNLSLSECFETGISFTRAAVKQNNFIYASQYIQNTSRSKRLEDYERILKINIRYTGQKWSVGPKSFC